MIYCLHHLKKLQHSNGNNGDELQLVTVFIPLIVYNNHGITKEIKRSNYIVAIYSLISIFFINYNLIFWKGKKKKKEKRNEYNQ